MNTTLGRISGPLSALILAGPWSGLVPAAIVQEGVATIQSARKAIEDQDWDKAHGLALTALKLNPDSIDALRLVFQTASRQNPAQALETASSLFQHPKASFEEKVKSLTYVQLKGDHARFAPLYDQLTGQERQHSDVIFLKVRFLARQGALEGARSVLEEYFKNGGGESRFKLMLASLLIQSAEEEDRRRGQQAIAGLMAGEGMDSRVAFNLLGDAPAGTLIPDLFPADIDAFVNALPGIRPQEEQIASRIKLARRKDEARALEAWGKAFELAQKEAKGDSLLDLYRSGLEMGRPDVAARALLEAANKTSGAFPPAAQLQPVFEYLYQKDRLDDLLLLTWTALSRESSNLLLVNNFLYLSMLLNRAGNDYVAQAAKMVDSQPQAPAPRSTLAFAHLRKGEPAQALQVLNQIEVDWSKEPPPARAIRAVALEKNGKVEEARAEWNALAGSFLAPAERNAFDALLGRSG